MPNLLVLSDGPNQPSGLARITKDLVSRLYHDFNATLNITQLGYRWGTGEHPSIGPQKWYYKFPWRVLNIEHTEEYGALDILDIASKAILDGAEDMPDAIFTVWDPARIVAIVKVANLLHIPVWAYLPIDSMNVHGKLSGPALDAIRGCERVLAYGPFGAQVLKSSLDRSNIGWLPHGLDDVWYKPHDLGVLGLTNIPIEFYDDATYVVGIVMTNQPRKDFGLTFQTLTLMREKLEQEGKKLKVWIHTDMELGYWVLPQLALDFNWSTDLLVTTEVFSDEQMKALYSLCDLVMLPSLGEGFGYPTVEAQAVGVRCGVLHGAFAGGATLVPHGGWRVPVASVRLDGSYALQRPLFSPEAWSQKALALLAQGDSMPHMSAYLRGNVEHLSWSHLWPRWRGWFKSGFKQLGFEL